MGAPKWPPGPPRSAAPRRSRGAPRFRLGLPLGAPKWPPGPLRSAAPRRSRGAPRFRLGLRRRPRNGPPRFRLGVREVGDEPAGGAQELSVPVAGADELDAHG